MPAPQRPLHCHHVGAAELRQVDEVAQPVIGKCTDAEAEVAPGSAAGTTAVGEDDGWPAGILAQHLIVQADTRDLDEMTFARGDSCHAGTLGKRTSARCRALVAGGSLFDLAHLVARAMTV